MKENISNTNGKNHFLLWLQSSWQWLWSLPNIIIKQVSIWFWLLLVMVIGVVFIWTGNAIMHNELSGWDKILPKVLIDFGIALVVAAVVAGIFDKSFHHAIFGVPIENIEQRMNTLVTDVELKTIELNNSIKNTAENMSEAVKILQTINYLKIHSIKERHTEIQKNNWLEDVEKILNDSKEFIYIMGRTLEELFERNTKTKPDKKLEPNVISIFREKLRQEPFEIKVILADTFTDNSVYVSELKWRNKIKRRDLMAWNKDTSERLLKLKYLDQNLTNSEKDKIEIKLSKEYIPYMMIMTDKIVMIQSYIPFEDGYKGIVTEINKPSEINGMKDYGLYDDYEYSYKKTFEEIGNPKDALQVYPEINSTDNLDLKNILDAMEKIKL